MGPRLVEFFERAAETLFVKKGLEEGFSLAKNVELLQNCAEYLNN